jgi:hypothetical protein
MWSDVRHPALKKICSLRDSVIHSALFLKLLRAKIGGKFLAILKSLYSNLSFRVIVNSHSLSNAFPSNVGVFQDDNLSPNVFNRHKHF